MNSNTNALINGLNEIAYLHEDLMSIAVEYFEEYSHSNSFQLGLLNKLWAKPEFLQQCVLSVREALILSTISLSLDESVDFNEIMVGCINTEMEKFNLQTLNPIEHNLSVDFFNSLRVAVYDAIFKQNYNMKEATQLTPELLNQRYELFVNNFTKKAH